MFPPGIFPRGFSVRFDCFYLFYSDRDGDQEIYMMDVDGGNVVQLTHNTANDNTPRWSPDGTKISFVSDRDGSYDVFVMDADGGNVVKLSNSSHSEGDPYWSPDGSQILFSWSTTSGGWDMEAFVVNADGTNLTQITNTPSTNQHPRWSPDGSKIIVSSYRTEQHCLFVMDPDGSNQTQLTSPWIGSWCCPGDNLPAWSPDGTRIAFTRDRGWQSRGLFIMNADGSGQTQFSIGLTREENAVWSPDGATIVFQGATSYNGDYHLWLIDADDSNPRELTGESGREVIPSWSPDGSKILFASNRDGDYELYTIDPDGSNLTQLTFNDVADYPAGMGAWTSAYSSPVSVTVPSVTTAYDASLVIPVELAGVEEREIVSAEVFLGYDSSLLTFAQVLTDQLLADGWKIEVKDVAGTDAMRTVRIRVIDADLSEGVEVSAANGRTGEVETILLSAFEVGSSHFLGRLFTDRQAGAVGDSTLEVAKGDTLVVTYADTLTAEGGMVAEVDDDEVVDPFGDADGNGSVQAFDAARVRKEGDLFLRGRAVELQGTDPYRPLVEALQNLLGGAPDASASRRQERLDGQLRSLGLDPGVFASSLGELLLLDRFAPGQVAKSPEIRRHVLFEGVARLLRPVPESAIAGDFPRIVGRSPAMERVLQTVERVAQSAAPALIQGESGTGKEVIARAIHEQGPRAGKAFVAQNCAALPESLLESELFGHKKGAFTGATADKPGLFEVADGGTIFLDEVADASPGVQAKLLRAVEEGEIRRVGDTHSRKGGYRGGASVCGDPRDRERG